MSLLELVSKRIRSIRLASGLTQEELAKKTQLSLAYVSKLERGLGNLTIPTLEKIADVLGISVVSLFERPEANVPTRGMSAGLKKDLEEIIKVLQKNLDQEDGKRPRKTRGSSPKE